MPGSLDYYLAMEVSSLLCQFFSFCSQTAGANKKDGFVAIKDSGADRSPEKDKNSCSEALPNADDIK